MARQSFPLGHDIPWQTRASLFSLRSFIFICIFFLSGFFFCHISCTQKTDLKFKAHILFYSERSNILYPVLLWFNLVNLTEQLHLWRYARSASRLPHPTTLTGVQSKRVRANFGFAVKEYWYKSPLFRENAIEDKTHSRAEIQKAERFPWTEFEPAVLLWKMRWPSGTPLDSPGSASTSLQEKGPRSPASQCQHTVFYSEMKIESRHYCSEWPLIFN